MLRVLGLLAIVSLVLCADANAHVTNSRMHTIRHVAQTVWGNGRCDVGTMNVPIIVFRGRYMPDAAGRPTGHGGRFYYDTEVNGKWTNCRVWLHVPPGDSTEAICIKVVHELGHAAGLPDDWTDPGSIMYARRTAWFPPCAPRHG